MLAQAIIIKFLTMISSSRRKSTGIGLMEIRLKTRGYLRVGDLRNDASHPQSRNMGLSKGLVDTT